MTIGVESRRVREELSVMLYGLAAVASGLRHRRKPIVRRGVVGIERNSLLQLPRRLRKSTCPGEYHAVIQAESRVSALELYRQVQLGKSSRRVAEAQRGPGEPRMGPVEGDRKST